MTEPQIVVVPKELYYHEVAYVRGLEEALRAIGYPDGAMMNATTAQQCARAALAAEPASGEANEPERIAPNFVRGPDGSPLYVGRRENAPPPTQGDEERALSDAQLDEIGYPDTRKMAHEILALRAQNAALRQARDEATKAEREACANMVRDQTLPWTLISYAEHKVLADWTRLASGYHKDRAVALAQAIDQFATRWLLDHGLTPKEGQPGPGEDAPLP